MTDYEFVEAHYPEILKRSPGVEIRWSTAMEGFHTGRFRLLMLRRGSERIGFIIYSIEADDAGSDLFILGMWAREGLGELENISSAMDSVAAMHGWRSIRFKTVRDGWVRRLRDYGFERTPYFEMRRELEVQDERYEG